MILGCNCRAVFHLKYRTDRLVPNREYYFFGLVKGRAPLFRLTVPRQHDLELSTSGGGIEVDDLQGRVSARTSGGSLSFGHIEGPIEGKTSGGSISLKGCSGTASVSTSGGSIRIGEVDGEVRAKTSGGSIRLRKL